MPFLFVLFLLICATLWVHYSDTKHINITGGTLRQYSVCKYYLTKAYSQEQLCGIKCFMKFNIGTIRAIKEWQIFVTMIHRTNDPHLLFIFCSFFLLIYGIFDKKMCDITYMLITFLPAVSLLSWQQHCHGHLCWYTVS